MITVEEIFHKKESSITTEDICKYFDWCIGCDEIIDPMDLSLEKLPKGWEKYLWEKYNPVDVVNKYRDFYFEVIDFYITSVDDPDDPVNKETFEIVRKFFLESWISSMVLKWIDEGFFDEDKKIELEKMYSEVVSSGD